MKRILLALLVLSAFNVNAQSFKKAFKFATFYGAVSGGNSVSDIDVYSVTNGLETNTIETPFDYSLALGVRKIARLGYENRANTFTTELKDHIQTMQRLVRYQDLNFCLK